MCSQQSLRETIVCIHLGRQVSLLIFNDCNFKIVFTKKMRTFLFFSHSLERIRNRHFFQYISNNHIGFIIKETLRCITLKKTFICTKFGNFSSIFVFTINFTISGANVLIYNKLLIHRSTLEFYKLPSISKTQHIFLYVYVCYVYTNIYYL